ncbi:hypothetical protein G6F53_014194 [Rhizopus delemar]|nr:hypothetical protein G6F53_014194 [Rhizopus delemar]
MDVHSNRKPLSIGLVLVRRISKVGRVTRVKVLVDVDLGFAQLSKEDVFVLFMDQETNDRPGGKRNVQDTVRINAKD